MGNQPSINKEDALYLLETLTKLMSDNNIITWLDCGTLLGAVRDNDFIGHDTDVDIAAYESNYNRARKLTDDTELLKSLNIKRLRTSADSYNRKILSFGVIDSTTYIDIYFWKWIPKRTRITFKNKLYVVPKYPEQYLEYLYGEDWKIPIKNDHAGSRHHKEDVKNSQYFIKHHTRSRFN
jgi:phosphorylcholine metabolism protein LicD